MANVKHSGLTGTDLHEPKGVVAAGLGQSYISDNAGSGSWKQIATSTAATETTMEPKGITAASEFEVYQRGAIAAGSWVAPTEMMERTYSMIYPTTGSQTFSIVSGEEDDKLIFTQDYSTDLTSSNITWNDTTKVFTYSGDQTIVVQVGIAFSITLTTGVGVTLKVALEKSTDSGSNWTLINGGNASRKFANGEADAMSFTTVVSLDTDDQLRLVRYIDTISTFTTDNININILGAT